MNRFTGYLVVLLLGALGIHQHAVASGVDVLRGLTEIEVAVVGLSPQMQAAGFDRERLYDHIERQMRRSRLQVRPFVGDLVGGDLPVLQVVPECSALHGGGYLCRVEVELLETVSPVRDMTLRLVVPTWRWSWAGELERISKVRALIESAVGQFADDYFAVN